LEQLLSTLAPSLREAIARGGDGLFTVSNSRKAVEQDASDRQDEKDQLNEADEIYHLSRRSFSLNGNQHELLMIRHLTVELRRQEVQTWKKVIRVISHELNNSLAPVASLANSAGVLVQREQYQRIPDILKMIEERAQHLQSFIEGYARFSKLPTPRIANHYLGVFSRCIASTNLILRIGKDSRRGRAV